MCPYMQFIDGGRRFVCNFCEASTDVPENYFAHLDHTGYRVDVNSRPEVSIKEGDEKMQLQLNVMAIEHL